jgi:prepilin-type processing-associated H-X9-DG protein
MTSGENTTVGYSAVKTLLCPSENVASRPAAPWAPANYAASVGGPGPISQWSGTIITGKNPWYNNGSNGGAVGFQSITDGTSNTGMFSERLIGLGDGTNNGPLVTRSDTNAKRALFSVGMALTADDAVNGPKNALAFVSACNSLPGSTVSKGTRNTGCHWLLGMAQAIPNNAYTHFGTPNTIRCTYSNSEDTNWWCGTMCNAPPTSNHPGGVNVGLADGSVKFIKDSISLQTWWALGTRSAGEIISSDAY